MQTARREQFVDITSRVAETVALSGLRHGAVLVSSPHTTAGITVNEGADPDVATDLLSGLSRVAPREAGWKHREGNSDAHLKTTLVGNSTLLAVVDGQLVLGIWQAVYLTEFDGPRTRSVDVTLLAGGE